MYNQWNNILAFLTDQFYPDYPDDYSNDTKMHGININKHHLFIENLALNEKLFDLVVPYYSVDSHHNVEIYLDNIQHNFLVINNKNDAKLYGLHVRKTHIFGLPRSPTQIGVTNIRIKLTSHLDGSIKEKIFSEHELIDMYAIHSLQTPAKESHCESILPFVEQDVKLQ